MAVRVQANSGEIEVHHGDLVVLATDGVWDNFSPDLLTTPAYSPVRSLSHCSGSC